jgi:hypothetical protein
MRGGQTTSSYLAVGAILVLLIGLSFAMLSCTSLSVAPKDPLADELRLTSAMGPLPDEAYKAILSVAYEAPGKILAGQRTTIHLLVNNASQTIWPYRGQPDGRYQVRAANRWRDQNGITLEDARGELPYDLRPGAIAEVLLFIRAPSVRGNYTLEFDLVQEQVAWFSQKGSEKLRMDVLVE